MPAVIELREFEVLMANPQPTTIGESLYWSYANLAMMANVLDDRVEQPGKTHFMIRSKLYSGLRKGTMNVRGFFDDEKLKLKLPKVCWYCGSTESLSVDHIIPQSRGGSDGGENLLFSCRSCNSSKGSTDLLKWMDRRGQFPPLYLLRRYLKMAIEHCRQHELMSVDLPAGPEVLRDLPFSFELIPHVYPSASLLRKFVLPLGDDDT